MPRLKKQLQQWDAVIANLRRDLDRASGGQRERIRVDIKNAEAFRATCVAKIGGASPV